MEEMKSMGVRCSTAPHDCVPHGRRSRVAGVGAAPCSSWARLGRSFARPNGSGDPPPVESRPRIGGRGPSASMERQARHGAPIPGCGVPWADVALHGAPGAPGWPAGGRPRPTAGAPSPAPTDRRPDHGPRRRGRRTKGQPGLPACAIRALSALTSKANGNTPRSNSPMEGGAANWAKSRTSLISRLTMSPGILTAGLPCT